MLDRRTFLGGLIGGAAVVATRNPIARVSEEFASGVDANRAKRGGDVLQTNETGNTKDFGDFRVSIERITDGREKSWAEIVQIYRESIGDLQECEQIPEGVSRVIFRRKVEKEGDTGETELQEIRFYPTQEGGKSPVFDQGQGNYNSSISLEVPARLQLVSAEIENKIRDTATLSAEFDGVKGLIDPGSRDVNALSLKESFVALVDGRVMHNYNYQLYLPDKHQGVLILVSHTTKSGGEVDAVVQMTIIDEKGGIVKTYGDILSPEKDPEVEIQIIKMHESLLVNFMEQNQ